MIPVSWFVLALATLGQETPKAERSTVSATSAAVEDSRWKNGRWSDPAFFPIAVWLQDPRNAAKYKQAGINLYVGLWRGPTEAQLDALKAAEMPVVCSQNTVGLARKNDPIIAGWMHGDEPDNAQPIRDPATGRERYGPPIPPATIVANYQKLKERDSSRPILLNLGQGVANDAWKGRGPGTSIDDYPKYVQGADIVSFDVYPVAGIDRRDGGEFLWYVPKGVERLIRWTEGKKSVWNCIECTHISDVNAKATPEQVKAEVWMALIQGSRGLIYFVHEFKPRFNEHALLDDPVMLKAVTALNARIRELAPVLNSPTIPTEQFASVRSSNPDSPIGSMVKRPANGDAVYLFSTTMRNKPTKGTFDLKGFPSGATIEVLDENRRITAESGHFEDEFRAHEVHLYRITPAPTRP